jgi:hypothetical protein
MDQLTRLDRNSSWSHACSSSASAAGVADQPRQTPAKKFRRQSAHSSAPSAYAAGPAAPACMSIEICTNQVHTNMYKPTCITYWRCWLYEAIKKTRIKMNKIGGNIDRRWRAGDNNFGGTSGRSWWGMEGIGTAASWWETEVIRAAPPSLSRRRVSAAPAARCRHAYAWTASDLILWNWSI